MSQTNHSTTYSSISPSRPELSTSGKVVLITGGSRGIGKAAALSFAASGAKAIVLFGRSEANLKYAADEIKGKVTKESTQVLTYAVEVVNAHAVKEAMASIKKTVGVIDILVHAAAILPPLGPLATTSVDGIWEAFEVNVKGTLIIAQTVLSYCSEKLVFVSLNTVGVFMPPLPNMGAYVSTKLPLIKLMEYFAAENPSVRVMNVHPGLIKTDAADLIEKTGLVFPYDDISLSANFIVWAASEEADFLKGKFVLANWDVDELKAKQAELEASQDFTLSLRGFPPATA